MENKINVAELLKDCPCGMELDCVLYDDVTLECVSDDNCYPIKIHTPEYNILLNKYGCLTPSTQSKCVIFPKGKTSWEGFVPPCEFKDGDIIFTRCDSDNTWISIFKKNENGQVKTYADYYSDDNDDNLDNCCVNDDNSSFLCTEEDIVIQRLATEEEKQKLFKSIEDDGYRWNEETKTLEKSIEKPKPKFKVGDKIVKKNSACVPILITRVSDEFYYSNTESSVRFLSISEQDNYELAPNKFDISTLIPFESRVLIRDFEGYMWVPVFWGGILDRKQNRYLTTRGAHEYCIPYEGNEHLLGKTDDCDNFYKTWEL